jgi:hypothetical protein
LKGRLLCAPVDAGIAARRITSRTETHSEAALHAVGEGWSGGDEIEHATDGVGTVEH